MRLGRESQFLLVVGASTFFLLGCTGTFSAIGCRTHAVFNSAPVVPFSARSVNDRARGFRLSPASPNESGECGALRLSSLGDDRRASTIVTVVCRADSDSGTAEVRGKGPLTWTKCDEFPVAMGWRRVQTCAPDDSVHLMPAPRSTENMEELMSEPQESFWVAGFLV